ncbi:MAG TPA: hypothetical protein VMW17_22965 [Candidatus Binatia bacterium]|nr:hypothetical protein [Candidatus Binatia bacterium]
MASPGATNLGSAASYRLRFSALARLLIVATVGCAPTAPVVQVIEEPPHWDKPRVYLTAARQRDEVARGLRAAGFQLVDEIDDRSYFLRVTIGSTQSSRPCGTLNNVRYELRVQGRTIVTAEAKGWTGTCEPNVFDDVGRELWRRLVESTTSQGEIR